MNDVTDVLAGVVPPQAAGRTVTVSVDGRAITVAVGATVIAAIAQAQAAQAVQPYGAAGAGNATRQPGAAHAVVTRRSVSGMLRGPVCGMGICQECRVTIDGRAHQLSCQTLCEPGMDVRTALGESTP